MQRWEQNSCGNSTLGNSQRTLACWRLLNSNGCKESSQRVVQSRATFLDGYQMCTSHAWAEEGEVGMLSWLGPPTMCWWHHYLVIMHMNSMCLWEWPKNRRALEAPQEKCRAHTQHVVCCFEVKCVCSVFARFHLAHFVRSFLFHICIMKLKQAGVTLGWRHQVLRTKEPPTLLQWTFLCVIGVHLHHYPIVIQL